MEGFGNHPKKNPLHFGVDTRKCFILSLTWQDSTSAFPSNRAGMIAECSLNVWEIEI